MTFNCDIDLDWSPSFRHDTPWKIQYPIKLYTKHKNNGNTMAVTFIISFIGVVIANYWLNSKQVTMYAWINGEGANNCKNGALMKS